MPRERKIPATETGISESSREKRERERERERKKERKKEREREKKIHHVLTEAEITFH